MALGAHSLRAWASKNPRQSAGAAGATLSALWLVSATKRNGLLVSRQPYVSLFQPPLGFLARLLERKIPSAPTTNTNTGAASLTFKGKTPDRVDKVVQRVRVQSGEVDPLVAYRRAAALLKSLYALDGLPGVKLYSSKVRGDCRAEEAHEDWGFSSKSGFLPMILLTV